MDWEFVRMYTDEGISVTNTKHREGFKRMIEDALLGKMDPIITKNGQSFCPKYRRQSDYRPQAQG